RSKRRCSRALAWGDRGAKRSSRRRRRERSHPNLIRAPAAYEDAAMYTSLTVESFRGLTNVTLDDLRRVNLIVGKNNAGKTSLLEAISQQSGAIRTTSVPACASVRLDARIAQLRRLQEMKLDQDVVRVVRATEPA